MNIEITNTGSGIAEAAIFIHGEHKGTYFSMYGERPEAFEERITEQAHRDLSFYL